MVADFNKNGDESSDLLSERKAKKYESFDPTNKESQHYDEPQFLSLDFDRIINDYSVETTKARNSILGKNSEVAKHHHHSKVMSNTGKRVTRWTLSILTGLFTGLTAISIVYFVDILVEFRVNRLNRQIQWALGNAVDEEIRYWYKHVRFFDFFARNFGLKGVYFSYCGYNLAMVLICTSLCVLVSPAAVGSGIPDVKAYLNGISTPNFADMKLFFIKLIGTILAVSSGLVLGPEGPIVHLGSMIGSAMTKTGSIEVAVRKIRKEKPILSRLLGCSDNSQKSKSNCGRHNDFISNIIFHLSHFRNDLERRNFISIGAGAGFSAAFGAPIGGLLYSMEEASSFSFSNEQLWRILTATCVASFCMAVYYGDLTRYSMLSLKISYDDEEEDSNLVKLDVVPLCFLLGAAGGFFGGMFNRCFFFLNKSRKIFYNKFHSNKSKYVTYKLAESATISLLTSCLMLTISLKAKWACRNLEPQQTTSSSSEYDPGFLHRFSCDHGQVNEIGSLFFGSREESLRDILNNPNEFEPETLLVVGLVLYTLMIITQGVALPSGMFMPTALIGSCLGGWTGLIFMNIMNVHPADFALIGAAAFLAGIQRNTVSLCVILVEGFGRTNVIIPIIITVVSARTIGDLFSEGVYEIGMELKEYPYLQHDLKTKYDEFTVADVMVKYTLPQEEIGGNEKPQNCINIMETTESIESLLLTSSSHAFPVIDFDKKYRGMVRRDQLVAALECKLYVEKQEEIGLGGTTTTSHHGFYITDDAYKLEDLLRNQKESTFVSADDSNGYLDRPEEVSPWLRDNVFVFQDDQEIMLGMDETLPTNLLRKNLCNPTQVKILEGQKVVAIVPDEEKLYNVNVASMMNKAAHSVTEDCPLSRAYDLFVSMGLRHLPVLSRNGEVIGMITRYVLLDEHVEKKLGRKF